jgi:outer membrane protein
MAVIMPTLVQAQPMGSAEESAKGRFLGLQQAIEAGLQNHPILQEALSLAKQRYKLGLGSIVEVTRSEVGLTAAQTKLAEARYDYKIAEVTLAYAVGGSAQLQIDPMTR